MRFVILALTMAVFGTGLQTARAAGVETVAVEANGAGDVYVTDATVEAVRQSTIASQVPGRVTALTVKAGDVMKNGQILARIDERAAAQQSAASDAQVAVARAQLEAASKEYDRSLRLFQKQYISQAAMEQAEARFKSSQAQANATVAQARAAMTETSFHTLRAPYNGVVANVTTEVGDMAVSGKPLLTVYDPSALRVVVNLPESYAAALNKGAPVRIEFPGAPANQRWLTVQRTTVLPTSDPASHTVEVRLDLAPGVANIAPGTFARAHLPLTEKRSGVLTIPVAAVIKRTELQAVYVATADGRFQLRQVRLGKVTGDRVEVLAGLQAGDRIALNPLAIPAQ
ncbi:MAG: efflux RND transporter periplasmic adaptor subunit [Betaproteobacteria bacterium]